MREVSHHIREAYLSALTGVTLDSVPIPFSDTYVVDPPEVRGAKVYGVVTVQEDIETTDNRCGQKQDSFITIEVVAKFPKGRGGKLVTELISDQVQQAVNSGTPLTINGGAKNALTRKELGISREEHTETVSIFRKVLTFSNRLTRAN